MGMSRRTVLKGAAATALVPATSITRRAWAADYRIRLALIAQTGQPVERGAQHFKELVESGSKGRISVQIFPGGQLGGEIEQQDSVANGTIQMANIGSPVTAGKLKKLDILNVYYLWKDRDHMDRVLTGPIGKELFAEYTNVTGIRVLTPNWQQGTRNMLTKRKGTKPEELNGIKIRVTAGVPLHSELWSAMGASPVPLPFPEAYSAMQTGVVDAVELPADWIFNNGFHRLGKFMLLTRHYFYTNLPIINAKFFESLPAELQALVEDASRQSGEFQTKLMLKEQDEIVGKIKDAGVELVETDTAAFRQAVQPVYEKNMATWGKDLFDRINAA
jgi:TRAP-type transport system periplasmic protein